MSTNERRSSSGATLKSMRINHLLRLFGKAVQTASSQDSLIREELALLPESFICCICLKEGNRSLVWRRQDQQLIHSIEKDPPDRPEVSIILHSREEALLLLTFREHMTEAASRDRLSMQGSISQAAAMIRIIERTALLMLPKTFARRAVKRYRKPDRVHTKRLRLYARYLFGV